MTLLIELKSSKDKKLFTDLAKRLELQTLELSKSESEDFSFGKLMEEGLQSKTIDTNKFMQRLNRRKGINPLL